MSTEYSIDNVSSEVVHKAALLEGRMLQIADEIIKRHPATRLSKWLERLDNDERVNLLLDNYTLLRQKKSSPIDREEPQAIHMSYEAVEGLEQTWPSEQDRRGFLIRLGLSAAALVAAATAIHIHARGGQQNMGPLEKKINDLGMPVTMGLMVATAFVAKHDLLDEVGNVVIAKMMNPSETSEIADQYVSEMEPLIHGLSNRIIRRTIQDFENNKSRPQAPGEFSKRIVINKYQGDSAEQTPRP